MTFLTAAVDSGKLIVSHPSRSTRNRSPSSAPSFTAAYQVRCNATHRSQFSSSSPLYTITGAAAAHRLLLLRVSNRQTQPQVLSSFFSSLSSPHWVVSVFFDADAIVAMLTEKVKAAKARVMGSFIVFLLRRGSVRKCRVP